jgi:uncharacterized protein
MKILVDINHPAHVHFFRNFITEARKRGHEVIICASRKDIAFQLLDEYKLDFISLGSYGRTTLMKLMMLPVIGIKMLLIFLKHKPDVVMGIASFRAAQAAWLLGKKSYIFDDTEHSRFEIMLYKPFATCILTPNWFKKNLGKKHIKYQGYHELAYLHPDWFIGNKNILKELNVRDDEAYVIIRFIGWDAFHDTGKSGLSLEIKRKTVKEISKIARVFITSERALPEDLEPYRLKINPSDIHHVICYSSLVFGESATMASEAAVLGVPAIYFDNFKIFDEENRFGNVFTFTSTPEDQQKAIDKAIEILSMPNAKEIWMSNREILLQKNIDITRKMLELIIPENSK